MARNYSKRSSSRKSFSKKSYFGLWLFVLLLFVTLTLGLVYLGKKKQQLHPKPLVIKTAIVVPVEKKPKTFKSEAKTISHEKKYEVEIAKVSDYAEADRLKAELALVGFVANIILRLEGGVRKYQVYLGPYDSKRAALLDIAKLKQNKIVGKLMIAQ